MGNSTCGLAKFFHDEVPSVSCWDGPMRRPGGRGRLNFGSNRRRRGGPTPTPNKTHALERPTFKAQHEVQCTSQSRGNTTLTLSTGNQHTTHHPIKRQVMSSNWVAHVKKFCCTLLQKPVDF